MGYGSFLLVRQQPAGSAIWPRHAVEAGRSRAAGHKKEMSNIGKNQAPAPTV
jgi:hypothetical protein